MNTINFSKMHGLGNSFMVIDQINQPRFSLDKATITALSDPNTGVGFDQLLIIAPPSIPEVDFDYLIFNANGEEVEQCGNGARCFFEYINQKGLSKKDEIIVNTQAGIIKPRRVANNLISVNMGAPKFNPSDLPFIPPEGTAPDESITYEVELNPTKTIPLGIISMGNPHAVILVTDVDNYPVEEIGPIIESHFRFPKHTNVGFLEVIDTKHAKLRVYERGVGETKACGTGACAAAVFGQKAGVLDGDISITLPGGELSIQWGGSPTDPVYLQGPAKLIFDGSITIPVSNQNIDRG